MLNGLIGWHKVIASMCHLFICHSVIKEELTALYCFKISSDQNVTNTTEDIYSVQLFATSQSVKFHLNYEKILHIVGNACYCCSFVFDGTWLHTYITLLRKMLINTC